MKITKTKILFFFLATFVLTNSAVAQKVAGYSFDKYPSTIYKGPKAKVNLKSGETARGYRTTIKEQYSTSKIDFAGHYSLIFWGAGTNLSVGAMVDNISGNVYDLPLTEENASNYNCNYIETNDEGNIHYNKASKLFTTSSCERKDNESTKTFDIIRTTSIFLWDDNKKKFILLNKKTDKKLDINME